jgi:hypothetical protein
MPILNGCMLIHTPSSSILLCCVYGEALPMSCLVMFVYVFMCLVMLYVFFCSCVSVFVFSYCLCCLVCAEN